MNRRPTIVSPTHALKWLLVLCGLALSTSLAADILVHNQAEYAEAVKTLQPGDTLVLADGTWENFEMVFTGSGTRQKPITLTAQTKGGVFITGESNLRIAGEHLVVSGLVFKNGYTPTREVISFRLNKNLLANNTRVTEVVIDHFNNPERFETDFWVIMYGKNNRFDHNHLVGKSNAGVTMAVRLNTPESQENNHRIDHNYFGPRDILGSNGGETLRIGTSHYSLSNSFTKVEHNYFDRCDGELEVISNKSGGNEFRGNYFFESRGTLTMRHGNDNLVEDNVFVGNGRDHTGGIRVINKRQTIRNNYMEGLTGYRLGGGFVVMNGVPNSPINRYHQVDGAVIENNSIINTEHVQFAAGSDAERSAVPINSQFNNNLIYHRDGKNTFTIFDDISGIAFKNNWLHEVKDFPIETGFKSHSVKLEKGKNGLMYPKNRRSRNIGVSRKLNVLDKSATGVDWYPKAGQGERFSHGATIRIEPGEDTLTEAVKAAKDGDTIELESGDYLVTKLLTLDGAVTVKGLNKEARPRIEYERSALFEIKDGGALKLEDVVVTGNSAPDVAGNSVIRTSRYSMLSNYELQVHNSEFVDLDVNHSFHFLSVSKHTFASNIEISGSVFRNITGDILNLDKETDDLGIYNSEYVSIVDTRFEKIGGAVLDFYRGGTDESTFGPHFVMRDSHLEDVGNNKRNKTGASIRLLGVQVTNVHENVFKNSKPILVFHTVGEPITKLSDNTFKDTPEPTVNQL
ncbi:MAG: chondroitinase-B domain-containing protein [Gammaproteobacteria bacterium]